ncbi:MAG: EamA family transporter [Planctomycetota bacterium]
MSERSGTSPGVVAAVTVMCVIWGSTWLVVREGLTDLPPFGSAGIRFLAAGVMMLLIAPFIARVEGGARPTPRLVLAMATGNFALSYGIVYWAEVVLPSSLAAIIWGVFPLVTALVGHVYLPESRIVGAQWLGLGVGFLGVLLLFVTDLPAIGPEALERGAVLLLSPIVSAFATAYVKRHGAGVSAALLNRSAMLVGGALLCLFAWWTEGGLPRLETDRALFSVGYLAIFGTVVTFTLYFWVLRNASPTSLSLIAYVTPAIALLVGVVIGDEDVSAWTAAGLALILLGSLGVLRRPSAGGPIEGEDGRAEGATLARR